MHVHIQPVRLGDRARKAPGWLVVSDGAIRAILSEGEDGEIVLAMACDRRIQCEDLVVFGGLREAHAWLTKRLAASRAA